MLRRARRLTNPAQPSALVTALFGAGVVAAELYGHADASLLYAAEAALCVGFAPQRLADFTAGRLCARRALAGLGIIDFPLASNPDRTARWPAGIVGSISHTEEYCCAVVAPERGIGSIGVDAEIVGRVTSDLDALIFTQRETAFLATLGKAERARAATVIFSAKEAFYKCQFVLTHRWLEFVDASVELHTSDMQSGVFGIEPAGVINAFDTSLSLPIHGKFRLQGDIAITGIALRAEPLKHHSHC